MKKVLKMIFMAIFLFITLVVLLNFSDSELKPEVQEILQVSATSTEQESKQCAAALGLFVDEKLDFESEGQKFLTQLQSEPLNEKTDVTIPIITNNIQDKEKCEGICHYSKGEKERLKLALANQKVYLTRFKKVMEGNSLSCHHPTLLFKFPILSHFHIARQQVMEYRILAQEGKIKEAQEGLIKMNAFFENTLLKEKYTLVASLMFVKTLNSVREVLSALPTFNHATIKFKAIAYEDISKRAETGELQSGNALLSLPMERKFFQKTSTNDHSVTKKDSSFAVSADNFINKILDYFFLKNETLNDNFQALKLAAWHSCIGQEDIPCEIKSPNPFAWLRNPVGKSTTLVLTSTTPNYFRKLKNNINELSITTYNSALRKK